MVAGLVPRARGIPDEDLARAVHEREELLARRARELAEEAVRSGEKWAKYFGPPPTSPGVAGAWWDRLAVVAAYRERWQVGGPGILGDEAGSLGQALHRERARRAGHEAAAMVGLVPLPSAARSPPSAPGMGAGPDVEL
jgi:hypothetical protein